MLWLLFLILQAQEWQVHPDSITVGDTIWVERSLTARPGWVIRAPRWELTGAVEPLAAAIVDVFEDGGVRVRYPLVAWEPGEHRVTVPGPWRLGPGGVVDSVPEARVTITIQSVLPGDSAQPMPPREPIMRPSRHAGAVVAAILLGVAIQLLLVRWRRRPARSPLPTPWPATGSSPPGGFEGITDSRVVAARAAARLRDAIAERDAALHRGLTTEECLATLAERHHNWPVQRLEAILRKLDRARFADLSSDDAELMALAALELEARLRGDEAE